MTSRQDWFSIFSNWPAALPRKGVLVTSLNETIAFKDFWLKDELLLVERIAPDAMGARFVVLNYEVINLVKFTNPLSAAEIASAGFTAELTRKKSVAGKPAADKTQPADTQPVKTPAAAPASTAPAVGTPRTPVA